MFTDRIAVCLAVAVALVSWSNAERIATNVRSLDEVRGSATSDDRHRGSRSNANDAKQEGTEDFSSEELVGYRFGDEFFKDQPPGETAEASEPEVANARDATDKANGCERVVRDSMICMVCKDPRTNSNYEQCSYVARPKDKIQTYASSRSFATRPKVDEDETDETKAEASPYSRYEEEGQETTPYGRYEKDDEEETSGTYGYNKPPSYGNVRSASYIDREIESSSQNSSPYHDHGTYRAESSSEQRDFPEDYYHSQRVTNDDDRLGQSSHRSADRQAPNSQHPSRGSDDDHNVESGRGNCREVQKDSMTCTICSNPENGGNFEKCSYTHQPNERLYKYSKSKSFGYPHESSQQESKRQDIVKPVKTKKSPCRKYRKNSTTVCSVCENAKNGKYEQCEYNLKSEPSGRRVTRTIGTSL